MSTQQIISEISIIAAIIGIIIVIKIVLSNREDSELTKRLRNPSGFQNDPAAIMDSSGSYNTTGELTGIEQKTDFENLKKDNQFLNLMFHINSKHRTSFDNPIDEDTYKVVYAVKMTFSGAVLKYNDPSARYLIAYLQSAKNNLQFTFDMKKNDINERKIPIIVFNAAVPAPFRKFI